MSVKLLTEHRFEFLSFKKAAQARLSEKCHIVGNHMSRLMLLVHISIKQNKTNV